LRAFFLFLVVGGITAVIYFGQLAVFLEILHFDYRVGVSIAYITAVSFHFVANRQMTFCANHENSFLQVARYLPMVTFNYLLTVVFTTVSVEILKLSPYVGGGLAIIVTTGFGFFICKAWVFRSRKENISG
jgi:putative flippase GtrA